MDGKTRVNDSSDQHLGAYFLAYQRGVAFFHFVGHSDLWRSFLFSLLLAALRGILISLNFYLISQFQSEVFGKTLNGRAR